MTNQQNYNCPQCGQVDRVEKVSALVGAGTSAGLYGGPALGSNVLVGASQTAMSQKLSPPTKPSYQSPWGCVSSFVTGVGICLGTIFLIILFVQLQRASSAGIPIDSRFLTNLMIFLAMLITPFIISFLIIILKATTAKQRKITFETEYPRWQHAIAKWNELYYCARNDVIFIPGKPQDCVPVSQMSKLLYKP